MARYRVTVRGSSSYQRVVESSDALGAASAVAYGDLVTYLGGDLYADSAGHVIRVERIADGEDDPLPRSTQGEDEEA